MTRPWPHKPHTFRALKVMAGGDGLWVRCDSCRRFGRFLIPPGLMDADYRKFHHSCSKCGGAAALCVVHPHKDRMTDYKEVEPSNLRHPKAQDRMLRRQGKWIPPKLRWKPMH